MLLLFCKLSDIIGVREREIEQRMPDHGHSSWEAQFNGLDKVSAYEGLFMDYELIEYFTNAYYGCVVTSQSKQNVSCHDSDMRVVLVFVFILPNPARKYLTLRLMINLVLSK